MEGRGVWATHTEFPRRPNCDCKFGPGIMAQYSQTNSYAPARPSAMSIADLSPTGIFDLRMMNQSIVVTAPHKWTRLKIVNFKSRARRRLSKVTTSASHTMSNGCTTIDSVRQIRQGATCFSIYDVVRDVALVSANLPRGRARALPATLTSPCLLEYSQVVSDSNGLTFTYQSSHELNRNGLPILTTLTSGELAATTIYS